jgi:anti-sigma B factor antagonist
MLYDFRTTQESGIHIIRMWGELVDRAQANKMVEFVDAQISNKDIKFIFDLAELKYMNSSGLNVLINLFTKIRKEGGEMVITNVNKKIQELLIITKLTTLFTVTDSKEKAFAKLNGTSAL